VNTLTTPLFNHTLTLKVFSSWVLKLKALMNGFLMMLLPAFLIISKSLFLGLTLVEEATTRTKRGVVEAETSSETELYV
jgi:large-conductance mechanosensitive channel